jgi:hypothetical protein
VKKGKTMTELTGIALLRTVLPDEFSAQLGLIAYNWKRDKFAIGDIRNSLKAMVEERLLPIAAPDIDDFIAECLNHEIEPRTVRYYAMIAYAFPEPTREKYKSLSHAHYACANSYGDEKSISVLQLAKDREEITGKVPSCAWLRAAMNGYIYERASGDFITSLLPDEPVIEDDFMYIPSPEEPEKPAFSGWLAGLGRVVKFSLEHIEAVPLESEAKLKLIDLLSQVDTLLNQYIIMV